MKTSKLRVDTNEIQIQSIKDGQATNKLAPPSMRAATWAMPLGCTW